MHKLLTGFLGIMAHNQLMLRAEFKAKFDYEATSIEGNIQTWILMGCFEQLLDGYN